jgi:hypothetical protein
MDVSRNSAYIGIFDMLVLTLVIKRPIEILFDDGSTKNVWKMAQEAAEGQLQCLIPELTCPVSGHVQQSSMLGPAFVVLMAEKSHTGCREGGPLPGRIASGSGEATPLGIKANDTVWFRQASWTAVPQDSPW